MLKIKNSNVACTLYFSNQMLYQASHLLSFLSGSVQIRTSVSFLRPGQKTQGVKSTGE